MKKRAKDKLLYELEYQVNELREANLKNIEYNDMTIKELLDLGFNNCYIRLDGEWFNLGFKHCDDGEYGSGDFGILNKKQLNCIVSYVSSEVNDYDYLEVNVKLTDGNDKEYFIDKGCE